MNRQHNPLTWDELLPEHNNRRASVTITTPEVPHGSGPFIGKLCVVAGCVPYLDAGRKAHSFAGWAEVTFVD